MKIMSKIIPMLLALTTLLYSTFTVASIKIGEGGICPLPSYPEVSISSKEEGLVEFSMRINESGRVIDIEIIKSSGFKNLDDATKKNFKLCKFPKKVLASPDTEWVKIQSFKWRID